MADGGQHRGASFMIIYVTGFDVSIPNGPGVNEQQFILSMSRICRDDVRFLIPRPRGVLPSAFPVSQCCYLPEIRGRHAWYWILHQIGKFRAMRAAERKLAPDLFIVRPDVLPIAELSFARGSHVPYCTKTVHLSTKMQPRAPGLRGLLFAIHHLALEKFLRGAVVIDVVSEIHRRDILKFLDLPSNRVTVTDNAVDNHLFRPLDKKLCRAKLGLETFDPLFGYVGNLAAVRGGSELICALPMLLKRFPAAGVLVVEGDQAATGALRDLAQSLGVAERTVFRGPVPLAAVAEHIAALDVAASFREDDGCSELKVRQYIACGRPVVASAAVNQFIETERLGSIVDRRDPLAIESALVNWAQQVVDPDGSTLVAERLSRYARVHLDMDATNRRRVAAWLAAAKS